MRRCLQFGNLHAKPLIASFRLGDLAAHVIENELVLGKRRVKRDRGAEDTQDNEHEKRRGERKSESSLATRRSDAGRLGDAEDSLVGRFVVQRPSFPDGPTLPRVGSERSRTDRDRLGDVRNVQRVRARSVHQTVLHRRGDGVR